MFGSDWIALYSHFVFEVFDYNDHIYSFDSVFPIDYKLIQPLKPIHSLDGLLRIVRKRFRSATRRLKHRMPRIFFFRKRNSADLVPHFSGCLT